MHDDQIRSLLRNLERDQEPDPAFADALFDRLAVTADDRRRGRTPFLLLAAALLLTALAAGAALGSGWLRLPLLVDATQSPEPTSSGVAVASPRASASPSQAAPSVTPAATPGPVELAGRTLFVEADGLRVRAEASDDADVVATLRRGQLMGATGNQVAAGEMEWYEVRIGPGSIAGWVAGGPDGAWLRLVEDGAVAFHCNGCGSEAALVSITPFGDAAVTTIAPANELQDWAWSPDGSRLAVTVVGDTGTSVAVMGPDGSNRQEVGPGGYGPHWSPDGTRLAWSTSEGLVITDGELSPTLLDAELRNAGSALWSPDGSRLGVAAIDCQACPFDEPIVGDPPSAIYTVSVAGSDLVQLTNGNTDGFTGWAADGSRVAIIRHDLSGELPTRALTMPASGGEETILLDGTAAYFGATWSPDGTRMATATPEGVVVLDGDGSNPRVVAEPGETGIGEVAWSPSGRYLLFGTGGSSAELGLDLFIVPADGSDEPTPITPEEQESRQAVWQPILAQLP